MEKPETDMQKILIMLAKINDNFSKTKNTIRLTDRNVEINFNDDGSLYYFYSHPKVN